MSIFKSFFRKKDMNSYTVSAKTCRFIAKHFFEWSDDDADDQAPNRAAFEKLAHPAELHFLASIYNWDDGASVLLWILESELCARSTANLLFWRAAPDWYLRCDLKDIESCPSFNRDGFLVIRKIIEKYEQNSFSPYQIHFDPTREIETITEKNPKWAYPDGVYDLIEGVHVSFEG